MHKRNLAIVNLMLAVVCGGCVWALATVRYERPAEIAMAEEILMRGVVTTSTLFPGMIWVYPIGWVWVDPIWGVPQEEDDDLNRMMAKSGVFGPLYTPKPTPTPTPTPTPEPPELKSAVAGWEIIALDERKAEFMGGTRGDVFEMSVGGPGRATMDGQGRPITVSLIGVDTVRNTIRLGFGGQVVEMAMFP